MTVINYLVHLLKQTLSGLDLVPLLKQTISGLDGNVGVLPAVIHTIRVNINHLSLNLFMLFSQNTFMATIIYKHLM